MSRTGRLVTAAELERLPGDDCRYELVEGRVVRLSPVGYRHGRLVSRLLIVLNQHLHGRSPGAAVTEVGFVLATNPDTVRAPDAAFIRPDRLPSPDPAGFLHEPPDLAIEVQSPEDRPLDMRAKVEEYLDCGVPLVLTVDGERRTVTVHRRLTPPLVLRADDDLVDLGDVVEGFTCTLREIFD